MKFLPVSSNLVSPEHAFTIAKGQEYKAPPSFFGKIKSSHFFCAHSVLHSGKMDEEADSNATGRFKGAKMPTN